MGGKIKETEKGIESEREQNVKSTLMVRKLRNVSTLLAQINAFQTVNSQKTSHVPRLSSSAIYRHKTKSFHKHAAFVLLYQQIPADQYLYLSDSSSQIYIHRCHWHSGHVWFLFKFKILPRLICVTPYELQAICRLIFPKCRILCGNIKTNILGLFEHLDW